MKNIFKTTILIAFISFFTSCETGDLDLLESPNNINAESADASFVLNDIQLTFNGIIGGYSGRSQRLVRQLYQFGTYNNAIDNFSASGSWSGTYAMNANIDILENINDQAEEGSEIPYHVGIAQVLEAYSYMLLVDFIGDVPFSEANQPEEFPTPNTDSGAFVYNGQLELLDAAIANLNSEASKIPQDLFFGDFDASKWIALANSLKIRAYTNMRLVDPSAAAAGINAAVSAGYIDTVDEDFQFQYSTTGVPNESRHPSFVGNYQAAGAGQYMSNNFYDFLNAGDDQPPFIEEGTPDPRLRYYIYRQSSSAPSGSNLPCASNDNGQDYCYVGNLYWGRDHADDEGIPNDGVRRTTYGVYPAGGAFDREMFEQARAVSESMEGAGIRPILLSSYVVFNLAETSLTLGTNGGSPVSLLEKGIRLSMEKTKGFPNVSTSNPDSNVDYAMTQSDVDNYVSTVVSEFNNAGSQDAKLAIIAREAFLANWGNGIEAYNTYRRTGFPDLQSPILASGPFPRNWPYPFDEVVNNPNISQQPITVRVFWDNNPPDFID